MDRYFQRLKVQFNRAVQYASARWAAGPNGNTKVIVICPNCSQKLRIPARRNKLIVTCTVCRRDFPYQYYALGFSSSSLAPLQAGLAAGLAAFILVELITALLSGSAADRRIESTLIYAVFGAWLGTAVGAAEGFFRKNTFRLRYGLLVGGLLGLAGGLLTGLVSELAVPGLLSWTSTGQGSPWLILLARVSVWALLGLLIGGAYGVKENTLGDLTFGMAGGAAGGAAAALLFAPFGTLLSVGDGAAGRLLAFVLLAAAISMAIGRLREIGISLGRHDMYQLLTPRLPVNPRVLAQPQYGRRQA